MVARKAKTYGTQSTMMNKASFRLREFTCKTALIGAIPCLKCCIRNNVKYKISITV